MSSYAESWGNQEGGAPWNEEEAIRLMQEAGAEVAMYEKGGARMPNREHYCARIQEAHRVRDMVSYREALNGYVEAAREAHRQKAHRQSRGGQHDRDQAGGPGLCTGQSPSIRPGAEGSSMTDRREDQDREHREKTERRAAELRQTWRDHHPSEAEDEARRMREEISRLEEERRRLGGEVMEGRPGALEEDERLEKRILELSRRHEGGRA